MAVPGAVDLDMETRSLLRPAVDEHAVADRSACKKTTPAPAYNVYATRLIWIKVATTKREDTGATFPRALSAGLAAAPFIAQGAHAQPAFPAKPMTLVIPFRRRSLRRSSVGCSGDACAPLLFSTPSRLASGRQRLATERRRRDAAGRG